MSEKKKPAEIVRLDDYRIRPEPETFRQIGDVAMEYVQRLIRESEARHGKN